MEPTCVLSLGTQARLSPYLASRLLVLTCRASLVILPTSASRSVSIAVLISEIFKLTSSRAGGHDFTDGLAVPPLRQVHASRNE